MEEKKKVPRLRFPQFADAWEQRKVADVADIIAGGTPSTSINSYWEPKEIPWLSSGEVHKKYVTFTDNKISAEGMNHSSARLVKKDSVLIALAGQGKTRGTVAINRIPLTTNQSIAAMTFDDDIVPEFVFSNLDSRYDEIRKMSSGDGARGGLNKQIVGDIIIPYTSKPEQEQIGRFFESIDNLITLHQRKLEQVKSFKSGMLQKMFPKNGEVVPEIRFPGFTDAWEQRTFGEILDEFSNKSKTENEYPVLSSTNTGMEFRDGRVSGTSNVGYKIINNNDLVLSPQNLWLGNININDIGTGIVSPSYKTFKLKDIETDFFRPQIRTQYLMNEYYNASIQGASVVRRNLDNEKFNAISIFVPSSSEQVAIGCFFRNLDNLITLHQRKEKLLEEYKKGLLQKMFV